MKHEKLRSKGAAGKVDVLDELQLISCKRLTTAGDTAVGDSINKIDKAQRKPRDFGWKLRGARRISRDKNYSAGNRGLRATVRTWRERWKHQVATHRLFHLRHRLPLINDNTGACKISAVTAQRSKEQTTSTVHFIVVCHSYEPIRGDGGGCCITGGFCGKLLAADPAPPSAAVASSPPSDAAAVAGVAPDLGEGRGSS
jgi:hypothetical protein